MISMEPASIRLPPESDQAILGHARMAVPEEACGLVIGLRTGPGVQVVRVVPATNVWTPPGERVRRYALDPAEQLAVERAARADGLDVVGYYHSHPAGEPVPSETDRAMAWPGYVYLIAGVATGSVRAWVLDNDGRFVENAIEWAG